MSYSNGIITAPVSIDDVKAALGESSNDLATLCKSSNINMWNRRKPVGYPAIFTSQDGDWYKGNSVSDDYVNGIECCGIRKSVYDDVTTFSIVGNNFSTRHFQLNNTQVLSYVPPKGGENSPYRLGDFRFYDGNTPSYDKTGSVPYSTVINKAISGNTGITFGAQMVFDFTGNNGFLGLGELFGADKGNMYFCIIAEAASNAMSAPTGKKDNKRTSPLSIFCKGNKIDGNADATTGLSYVTNCTTLNYNYSSRLPTDKDYSFFSSQEYIRVACGILKEGTAKKYFFPLDAMWIAPNTALDTNTYCFISSAYVYVSVIKDKTESGYYWAYIANDNDFQVNVVSPAPSGAVFKLTTPLGIDEADGNINVQNYKSGVFKTQGNQVTSRTLTCNDVRGWSLSNPFNSLAMRFKSSANTIKLSFSFAIASKNGGSRRFQSTFSITLPSTSAAIKSNKIVLT